MKFKIVILLFTVTTILSGCLEKPLIFVGESDNWKVHYEIAQVKKPDGACNRTSGNIIYTGTDSTPERIEFSIDQAKGNVPLEENDMFTLLNGCSNLVEGSEVEAIIKWNDQTDVIPLVVQ